MLENSRQSFSSYLDRLLSQGLLTLAPQRAEKDLGMVTEITGGLRNRLFSYSPYMELLSEGTDPIR